MVPLRIVMADDHPFVRVGIRSAISAHDHMVIVGEAANPTSLIELLQKVTCDVLVTDLTMPNAAGAMEDGVGLLRRIRRDWPALPIVVLTGLTNVAILHSVMSDGALGMLSKTEPMDELVAAIRSVRAGRVHISSPIISAPGGVESEPGAAVCIRSLSPRETEVIGMFVQGLSISEIACALRRDVRTVSRLKRIAMAKLGVNNDPGLFAYVRVHGTV